jgi:hypothetical protein
LRKIPSIPLFQRGKRDFKKEVRGDLKKGKGDFK